MTDIENTPEDIAPSSFDATIDATKLAEMMGLPPHQAHVAQSFSGEDNGYLWTQAEAEHIVQIWKNTDDEGVYTPPADPPAERG